MTGSAIAKIHINNLATILTICFDIILPCAQGLPLMLVYVISVRAPEIQYPNPPPCHGLKTPFLRRYCGLFSVSFRIVS